LLASVKGNRVKPIRCPACQSDDLVHGWMWARTGVSFGLGFFKKVSVHVAACLACGAVTPYLDDAAIKTVRGWNAQRKQPKATADEL
jgi:Zn ribbon nucleic-acid-binding protein